MTKRITQKKRKIEITQIQKEILFGIGYKKLK